MECLQIGQTIELNNVRIHRFTDAIKLTDLVNAGKRGKVCTEISAYGWGSDDADRLLNSLSDALLECKTFEEMRENVRGHVEGTSDFNMEVRSHKGVRVAPSKGDFEPIIIENENVYVKVEWDSFIIRDKRDMNNEPRLRSDKATDAKKLHKLISSNKSEFDNFTFQNFHTLFTNQYDNEKLYVAGKYNKDFIGFHFWCAMD